MEKALDIFHNDYYSHPTGDLSWFFIVRTCWGIPGGKTHGSVGVSQRLQPPVVTLVHTQSPAVHQNYYLLLVYGFSSFCSRWVGLDCDSQVSPLFRFQGGGLPCILSSMISPSKVIIFQFIQLFLVVRMDMTTSKLFIFWSWNWKSFWSLIFKQTYCYIRWTSN